MPADNSAFALVEAFGPSLVLLFAVLLAASIVRKTLAVRRSDNRLAVHGSLVTEASTSDELKAALDNAVALNAFNMQAGHDPRVRLQAVVRFAPTDYEPAVGEIAQYFRAREVISIDLTNMHSRHAVRLVDFCSGMAVMCSGWIFRVTDNVIVLSPPG